MKTEIVYKADPLSRVAVVSKGEKQMATPAFFPAISSMQSLKVDEVLQLILTERYGKMLLSSYDVSHSIFSSSDRLPGELSEYSRTGQFVMMDSGMFESYWKGDNSWDFDKYKDSIKRVDSDFYMTFDLLPHKISGDKDLYEALLKRIGDSKDLADSSAIHIFHGHSPDHLCESIKTYLGQQTQEIKYLAVAERECGETLSARAMTIKRISKTLRQHGETTLLHILGCGNPISIGVYVYCGADTFDSIDWTGMIFDRVDNRILDVSQIELLRCDCEACKREKTPSLKRSLLHNLLFYQEYEEKIQSMIKNHTLRDYVQVYIGNEMLNMIDNS